MGHDKDLFLQLSQLPKEGFKCHFSRPHKGLDPLLEDVIQDRPYQVDLEFKAMGNAFSVEGSVKTDMPLVCSRCGVDFDESLNFKVNEILIVEEAAPRGSKNRHSQKLEDLRYCTYLASDIVNLGDFIRELVASQEPLQPTGMKPCDDNCPNLQEAIKKGWLKTSSGDEKKPNPFDVLKDLLPPSKK